MRKVVKFVLIKVVGGGEGGTIANLCTQQDITYHNNNSLADVDLNG